MKLKLLIPLIVLSFHDAHAGSATWNLNPSNSAWSLAFNWTPATVPDGDTDVATFGISNVASLLTAGDISVGGIVFNAGASAYSIANNGSYFGVGDAGVVNNSAITQNLVVSIPGGGSGTTFFYGTGNAGTNVVYNVNGEMIPGGEPKIEFYDSSTAGNASFYANPAAIDGNTGGTIYFWDASTAGNSVMIASGVGVTSPYSKGEITFWEKSKADNATLIADDGIIHFIGKSRGGTCRVEILGSGILSLDDHDYRVGQVTLGSIEGDGYINGAITVGSNNLSTTFSGVTSSLTKIGSGTLTVTGTGVNATEVNVQQGKLIIVGSLDAASGYQAATVSGGGFAGKGRIADSLVVGGSAAPYVSPGLSRDDAGSIVLIYGLIFNAGGTYRCSVDTNHVRSDQIAASSVTINSGNRFSFAPRGTNTLPIGTVFIVIKNTGAWPISGIFSDLSDGAIISAPPNTFQASYSGGDGNDLTLTVVP